jgi:hypothetical protein
MHVMCVAYALHKTCETILGLCSNVDRLVASGKKTFVKSPARIDLFKNNALDTPFFSSPVITHWGTWLCTFMYYGEIFEILCFVVSERCRDGASSVAILRDICNNSNELKVLITGWAYIHANPTLLSQHITKLNR